MTRASVGHQVGTDVGGRSAVLAAAGVGVLAAMGSAAWVTMKMQANVATRLIQAAALEMAVAHGQLEPGVTDATQLRPPNGDGVYVPSGELVAGRDDRDHLRTITVAFLGDSTSVGYGTTTADELPGVMLVRGIAAATGRRVRLRSYGLIGSGAADLPRQIGLALTDAPDVVPDVAVICTGANDVRDTIPPQRSAAQLGAAVRTLQANGIPVVAGTCPDFGVITPIPQPLRSLVRTWSRRLAAHQAKAVVDAGGRAVEIGKLVSPEFLGRPDLFAPDRFHPSGAGYARAVAVLLPATIDAVLDADGARAGVHGVSA